MDHGHRHPRQRRLQGLRPGRRRAIGRVLFQQNEIRHRLDGDQADVGVKGFILSDRQLLRRHADGEGDPLLLRLRGHGLLQLHRQRVLAAVGGPDDRRQPAQLQELTHQPHPGAGPPGDDQMHHHHQLVQPLRPRRGRQARRHLREQAPPTAPPRASRAAYCAPPPTPLPPAAAGVPAPTGQRRARVAPPAPSGCGASPYPAARRPGSAGWRTPGSWAKVSCGRIFGHC